MKRIFCLLLALCLLADCTPAMAEGPELTEGEQQALDILAHFDEFYETYPSVTEGTPVYIAPEDRSLVW